MYDPIFLTLFAVIVVGMLALDLGVFNKREHAVSNREAVIWSIVWVAISLFFAVFVYFEMGATKSSEFLTAYLIEKALSVDNLFVFILIFSFFKVEDKYHHKVLFWGVLGAIVLRAIFIFSGTWLIELAYLPAMTIFGKEVHLNVILISFGLFLVWAGIKSAFADEDDEKDFSRSAGLRFVRRLFPVTDNYEGGKFFVFKDGKRFATPLLLVVGVVEFTDLLFAVDSIPAIFAVSKDPFILYSSNIFAILGLRSLYFLLANFMHLFAYLKYGLSVILSFIGMKMIFAEFYKIPSPVSLSIVAGVLVLSVIASVIWKPKDETEAAA